MSILLALVALGCGNDALAMCKKLESRGVAKSCSSTDIPSEAPYADATAAATFAMASGGDGRVFCFATEEVFKAVLDEELRLGKLGNTSKHGVSMHQGYIETLCQVLLSDEATEDDEQKTRLSLGQKP
jgi:hypothetical protein